MRVSAPPLGPATRSPGGNDGIESRPLASTLAEAKAYSGTWFTNFELDM